MDKPFWSEGLHFSCQRCSGCCRHEPGVVRLSEADLERLLRWADRSREDFIASYCRWVDRGDGTENLCLREKKNYDCILWDQSCIAYESRPFQCSSYPFWNSLLQDEDWWAANAADCPGVNRGALHGPEEIEALLERRRREPYIVREKTGR